MKKDPRVYLAHILECIEKIERFTHDGREEFLRNELIQDALATRWHLQDLATPEIT